MTNLLDASRLEAGGVTLSTHPQDLGELIGRGGRPTAAAPRRRSVRVEIPDELPPVPCDYAQIDQVVTNLLENAILHTPPGTPVRRARRVANGGWCASRSSISGPGVPPASASGCSVRSSAARPARPASGLG